IQAEKEGGCLTAELRFLRGFTWFVGYLVNDVDDDVILLGLKDPSRPPLDIDCLVTAIKSAYSGSVPYCSLEDHPDPAYKKCVVEGVPWNTRWAETMIFADDDMGKTLSGALDPHIPGFKIWRRHFHEIVTKLGWAVEGVPSKVVGTRKSVENRFW